MDHGGVFHRHWLAARRSRVEHGQSSMSQPRPVCVPCVAIVRPAVGKRVRHFFQDVGVSAVAFTNPSGNAAH
jgi:hypothetical protein